MATSDERLSLLLEPTSRIGGATPTKVELPIKSTSHASSTVVAPQPRSRVVTILLVVGLIATALNLRIVINAVALVLDEIRESTGISSSAAGLLTTLPILCFGLISPLAPKLARRIGIDLALWGAMLVLILGILLRLIPSTAILFAGTAIIGLAIGIANVLLPASIKRDFPTQTGLMTGVLTMAMSLSGTLGVGLTIPLQDLSGFAWRGTIALWAIPAIVAAIVLLPRFRLPTMRGETIPSANDRVTINLWRDPLAWQVTLMMGLQAFIFYSIATWFPTLMLDNGVAKGEAGLYLSIANLAGFVSSFFVPLLSSRRQDQRGYVVGTVILLLVSIGGLMVAPTSVPFVWMIIFGLGAGSALSLAIAFFSLRSPDIQHAAQLSGMAQTVGYCLAATGPFLIGVLHDLSGGWTAPLVVVLVAIFLMALVAYGAASNRLVGSIPPT